MGNLFANFFIIVVIHFLLPVFSFAQDAIQIRIACNTGMVLSEPGGSGNIADPEAIFREQPGGTADFISDMALGYEAEVMIPVNKFFGIGVEAEKAKFNGHNENPVYYNYFAGKPSIYNPFSNGYSPYFNYRQEPLIYNTDVVNLLGNVRFYPVGRNAFAPFIKLFAGLALIKTQLHFQKIEDRENLYDPLFSYGYNVHLTEHSRYLAPHVGAGAGFCFRVSGNISVYADLSFSYIKSDILDGIPNFTYDQALGYSVYADNATITNQFMAGLSYALNFERGNRNRNKHTSSGGGKTDEYLPFYRRK